MMSTDSVIVEQDSKLGAASSLNRSKTELEFPKYHPADIDADKILKEGEGSDNQASDSQKEHQA